MVKREIGGEIKVRFAEVTLLYAREPRHPSGPRLLNVLTYSTVSVYVAVMYYSILLPRRLLVENVFSHVDLRSSISSTTYRFSPSCESFPVLSALFFHYGDCVQGQHQWSPNCLPSSAAVSLSHTGKSLVESQTHFLVYSR